MINQLYVSKPRRFEEGFVIVVVVVVMETEPVLS